MAFYSLNPVLFDGPSMVTSTGAVDLGTTQNQGKDYYVYCYNAGAADISIGQAAYINSGNSNFSVSVSNAASQACNLFVGVCAHATIPAGYYGWIMFRGISRVYPDASAVSGPSAAYLAAGVDGGFVLAPMTQTTGLRLAFTINSFVTVGTTTPGYAWILGKAL